MLANALFCQMIAVSLFGAFFYVKPIYCNTKACCGQPKQEDGLVISAVLKILIDDSRNRLSLTESESLRKVQLTRQDAQLARLYINRREEYSSYHVLFALQKHVPGVYNQIPARTKAGVLVSALKNVDFLNDWGYLLPDQSHDDVAAKALLEVGEPAVRLLIDVLDDREEAPLFGSEASTFSILYKYRRCDFAYRYLSLIRGRAPEFRKTPEERDKDIAYLKEQLTKEKSK